MKNQHPDSLLLNKILLRFKSQNIEMSYQQFTNKYMPTTIRYIIVLQIAILVFAFIFLMLAFNQQDNFRVYINLLFIAINIVCIHYLRQYFNIVKIVSQLFSLSSMIYVIEYLYINQGETRDSFPFLLCFFTYLTISSKSFPWINRSLIITAFCFYFFYRASQFNQRPGIYLYIFFQTMQNYLEEKQSRLKFYEIFRENKKNENFQNLIKNIIPCGLFVCSKQAIQSMNVLPQKGQKQKEISDTQQTLGQSKQNQFSTIPISPLQINFANRQCMEDLGIVNSSFIAQKINQFKQLNKYETNSQIQSVEKQMLNKSKQNSPNYDFLEFKKDQTLSQIIQDYLKIPIRDMIHTIEMNQKPEETYLNVPYENGFTDTKYFDIKLVNCQWDNTDACLCVLNNISQKVINQRQERVEEFQKKMMSTITHNLKTPLNGIILLLQCLLQQQNSMSEDIYSNISDIYTNSELLLCMINDVIDYSKIQQGCFKLSPSKFKINKLLLEIKDLYKTQLQKKQLKLLLDCQNLNEYNFNTDYSRLKQVLINLTGNALKFTFEGQIKVQIKETYVDPNIIEIEVTDTGNGISKHIKQSLLQQQTHENDLPKLDKQSGSGIGLNICQCLVDKLGPHSKLFIQSVEKQGTKISFFLYRNLNRKRMASYQNENVRKVYKKQLSLKSQYLSFNTNKTDFNYSIEDQQQNPETHLKLNLNSQLSNHDVINEDTHHKYQTSTYGTPKNVQEQMRQRKVSLFKEEVQNYDQNELDSPIESLNNYEIIDDDDNDTKNYHIANQNLKELRKYDSKQKAQSKIYDKIQSNQIQKNIHKSQSLKTSRSDRINSKDIEKSKKVTYTKQKSLDDEGETDEFQMNLNIDLKNQAKDDYIGLMTDRKINNIYRFPFKHHNMVSNLDFNSADSPKQKMQGYESEKDIFSDQNFQFIKEETIKYIYSPQDKPNQKQPLLSQKERCSIQGIQPIYLPQDNQFQFTSNLSNNSFEKIKHNEINQLGTQNQVSLIMKTHNFEAKMLRKRSLSAENDFQRTFRVDDQQENNTSLNDEKKIQRQQQQQQQQENKLMMEQHRKQINKKKANQKCNQVQMINEKHNNEINLSSSLDKVPNNFKYINSSVKYAFKNHVNNLKIHNEEIKSPVIQLNTISDETDRKQPSKYTFSQNNIQFLIPLKEKGDTSNNIPTQNQVSFVLQTQETERDKILQQNDNESSEQTLPEPLQIAQLIRQKSKSKDIKSQKSERINNILFADTTSNNIKLSKVQSSPFQEGKNQSTFNYKTNFHKFNIICSNNFSAFESNSNQYLTNSRQQHQSNTRNNKQSFNPQMSNLSNCNENEFANMIKNALQGKMVLIVDDTMFNVIALKALISNISQNKIIIDEAYNGRQAVQKVLQSEKLYDFIFMDVNMPVMDGLQSTENIKQINRNNKIIIVTAFSDETDKTECINRGADGFLTKPVKIKDLAIQIQNVIKLYQHQQRNADLELCDEKSKNQIIKENLLQQQIILNRISVSKQKQNKI